LSTLIIPATGETRQAELPAEPGLLIDWIGTERFPTPVMAAVYGSGPTGYPLARALAAAGIACSVAAASKLPSRRDRRKNDRVNSEWLARSLISSGREEVAKKHSQTSISEQYLSVFKPP